MTRRHVIAAAAVLLLPLVACGKKGPPLAPIRSVPGAVTDLGARLIGQEMQIRFTLPTQNVSGSERIDLGSVDIYAVTVAPGGTVPPNKELLTRKYLIASVDVGPPPVEEEAPAAEEPAQPGKDQTGEQRPKATSPEVKPGPKDERPRPGERVTFAETLTEVQLTPAVLPKPPVSGKGAAPPAPAALEPPVPTRYYIVRGRSRGGSPGAQSPRVGLPLVSAPEPPSAIQADVTEHALTLKWTAPSAVIDPVAAAANAQAWDAVNAPPPPAVAVPRAGSVAVDPSFDPAVLVRLTRLPGIELPPTVILPTPPRFNVYAIKDGKIQDQPLNASPLTIAAYSAGEPAWNQEVCFVIRTVRSYGLLSMESPASEPRCVTPADTFPPAAPAGLKAVAAAGAMNLIWDPSGEPDLGGYIVLRGEAPGDTLQALTAAPITETNYKDTTVTPGVRYVYAIVAVDKASPPNTSAQSARVEEVARQP